MTMLTLDRFNVRIVRTGDAYGLDNCLTNNDGPMVEFYDRKYMHTPRGQFVSRYFVSTLLERPAVGLSLDGGVPAWTVSADDMRLVDAYLRGFVALRPSTYRTFFK
jgi:hypothetical protein